jgi:CTP-dependent riboflavin kinase
LLANLRWLSTARVSYPRKITRKLAFHRFQGLNIEIIEEKNREKVIHSQFISPCSRSETRQFGRTQVVQINI